jgi:ribosomal-protein-alanine N-acetyltransferase
MSVPLGIGDEASAVRLRPWQESDIPDLVRIADNPRIASQLRDIFPHPYTRKAGEDWVDYASAQSPTTDFAIEADGVLVGGIGYVPGVDVMRCSAEVGYWLGEPFWGRGIATAAIRQLIHIIDGRQQFTRVFAAVFATNSASKRVLEKAGFTLEGVLRRCAIKNGEVRDKCLYSLLRPEEFTIHLK